LGYQFLSLPRTESSNGFDVTLYVKVNFLLVQIMPQSHK